VFINKNILLNKIDNIEIDLDNPSSIVKSLACDLVNHNLTYYDKCSGLDFITFFVTETLNIDLLDLH